MDLPHTPSSKDKLREKVEWILQDKLYDIQRTTKIPHVNTRVCERSYGVRVEIFITAPEYCHCKDVTCRDGKYTIQETLIRIKKDADLRHLELFVNSLKNIWQSKDD